MDTRKFARVPLVIILVAAGLMAQAIQPKSGRPQILRDKYGIPHIYAASEADATYAFGYAQAEDALPTMLAVYMEAKGRSAEMPEGDIRRDMQLRMWRFEEIAREAYGKLDAESKKLLDAFVNGVNAYIRENPKDMPAWAVPVTAVDVLSLGQMVSIGFDLQLPRPLPPTGSQPGAGDGSNWFALAPARSATGAAILSIDPHLRWAGATRWYEAHIKAGRMNVAGATLIGNPIITMGHTEHFAWAMTIAPTSTTVFYEEKLNPENHNQYWDGTKWLDMRVVKETFKVARGPEQTQEYRYTRNGPVIRVDADKHRALVARYGAWQATDSLRQGYEINRATTLDEFRRASAHLGTPTVNLLYADVKGNLFYRLSARIPLRPENPPAVLEGWNPAHAWQGTLPADKLPQVLNPQIGYLRSANGDVWSVGGPGAIRREAFAPYIQPPFETWRGKRLTDLLDAEKGKTAFERVRQIATDSYLLPAEKLKELIFAAYQRKPDAQSMPEVKEAVEILRAWNNDMGVEEPGASLMALVLKMGADAPANTREFNTTSAFANWGPDKGDWLLERLRTAALALKKEFGSVRVPYGQIHRFRMGNKELPLPGLDGLTLRAASGNLQGVKMTVTGGSSFSMLVDLRTPVRAVSLLPYGNSHRQDSKHVNDQMDTYSQRQYKPAWFSDDEVRANTESRKELVIGAAVAAAAAALGVR